VIENELECDAVAVDEFEVDRLLGRGSIDAHTFLGNSLPVENELEPVVTLFSAVSQEAY